MRYIQSIAVRTNMNSAPHTIPGQTQCTQIKEMYMRAQYKQPWILCNFKQLQCNNSLHNKCIFHFLKGATVPYLQLSYIHQGCAHSRHRLRKVVLKEHPSRHVLLLPIYIYKSEIKYTRFKEWSPDQIANAFVFAGWAPTYLCQPAILQCEKAEDFCWECELFNWKL